MHKSHNQTLTESLVATGLPDEYIVNHPLDYVICDLVFDKDNGQFLYQLLAAALLKCEGGLHIPRGLYDEVHDEDYRIIFEITADGYKLSTVTHDQSIANIKNNILATIPEDKVKEYVDMVTSAISDERNGRTAAPMTEEMYDLACAASDLVRFPMEEFPIDENDRMCQIKNLLARDGS